MAYGVNNKTINNGISMTPLVSHSKNKSTGLYHTSKLKSPDADDQFDLIMDSILKDKQLMPKR